MFYETGEERKYLTVVIWKFHCFMKPTLYDLTLYCAVINEICIK